MAIFQQRAVKGLKKGDPFTKLRKIAVELGLGMQSLLEDLQPPDEIGSIITSTGLMKKLWLIEERQVAQGQL